MSTHSEPLQRLSNQFWQRTIGAEGGQVDHDTEQTLQRTSGGGERLPEALQARLGNALGLNLARVHIHRDRTAGQLANRLGARAFTVGQDIYFGEGEYRPATDEGQRVLAHELAHVAQQSAVPHPKLVVGDVDDPAEDEADLLAEQAIQRMHEPDTGLAVRDESVAPTQGARRTIRREVNVSFSTELATADVLARMSDLEVHTQLNHCRQRLAEVSAAFGNEAAESYFLQVNISILETELNKRATQAADQVERACLARLTFYTNLLQNNKDNLFAAVNLGIANFANYSGISEPTGVTLSDVLSVAISVVPMAGPIKNLLEARLSGAVIGLLQEGLSLGVTKGEEAIRGKSDVADATNRAKALGSSLASAGVMQQQMGTHILSAINTYHMLIEYHRDNASDLRTILADLNNMIALNSGMTESVFTAIANEIELELYRQQYAAGCRFMEFTSVYDDPGVVYQSTIMGLPEPVRKRVNELCGYISNDDLAQRWGIGKEKRVIHGRQTII